MPRPRHSLIFRIVLHVVQRVAQSHQLLRRMALVFLIVRVRPQFNLGNCLRRVPGTINAIEDQLVGLKLATLCQTSTDVTIAPILDLFLKIGNPTIDDAIETAVDLWREVQ